MDIVPASFRYRSRSPDVSALKLRMRDLAASRVRYGSTQRVPCRIHVLLRREGWVLNHKKVDRLYKLEGLSLRLKKTKKRVSRLRVVQPAALSPNERWSLDFMSDTLGNGPRTRVLTIVDHFSRVSPAIEVDTSLSDWRVIEVLERAAEQYGLPRTICVDNGPEFSGRALDQWAHQQGVKLQFSRPGKPTDNAMIETFNAKVRAECLDQLFLCRLLFTPSCRLSFLSRLHLCQQKLPKQMPANQARNSQHESTVARIRADGDISTVRHVDQHRLW